MNSSLYGPHTPKVFVTWPFTKKRLPTPDLHLRHPGVAYFRKPDILKNGFCFVFCFYKKGLPGGYFKSNFLWFNKNKLTYNFSETYHTYRNKPFQNTKQGFH